MFTSTDAGDGPAASWTAVQTSPDWAGGAWAPAPACVVAALCVFADSMGYAFTTVAPAQPGALADWEGDDINGDPDTGTGTPIVSVACPSQELCVAVDNAGDTITSTNPTAGAMARWRRRNVLGRPAGGYYQSFVDLACPTTTLCVSIADHGRTNYVAVTHDPAAGPNAHWTRQVAHDGDTGLNSIACPNPALCVIADDSGRVLYVRTS